MLLWFVIGAVMTVIGYISTKTTKGLWKFFLSVTLGAFLGHMIAYMLVFFAHGFDSPLDMIYEASSGSVFLPQLLGIGVGVIVGHLIALKSIKKNINAETESDEETSDDKEADKNHVFMPFMDGVPEWPEEVKRYNAEQEAKRKAEEEARKEAESRQRAILHMRNDSEKLLRRIGKDPDTRALAYGTITGGAIAACLNEFIPPNRVSIFHAITAETLVYFYMILDHELAMGHKSVSRRQNIVQYASEEFIDSYQASFNMPREESGALFDERQAGYTEILHEAEGDIAKFTAEGAKCLTEIIALTLEKFSPAHYNPRPKSPAEYSPIAMGLILKYSVTHAVNDSIQEFLPDFISSLKKAAAD